jgi:hypothetical protein
VNNNLWTTLCYNVQLYAHMRHIYAKMPPTIQKHVDILVAQLEEANEDETILTVNTLVEAFFPVKIGEANAH